MSEEPDNLTLRLPHEIREILDTHSDMHRQHQESFEGSNRKIDAWQETTATGVGLAGVQRRIDRLEERVERIERRLELSDAAH